MKIENKSIYHQHNEIDENIQKNMEEIRCKRKKRSMAIILSILITLSILNILSVGFYKEDLISVKKHGIIMGIAMFISLIPYKLNYQVYRSKFMKLLLGIGSLLILIFMILGPSSIVKTFNGARGWISLGGFTLQPSEILKIPFIILLANVLAKGEEKKLSSKLIIFNSALVFFIFAFFICKQNDLGTVIHYGTIYIFMIFLTNIDKKLVTGTAIVGTISMVAGSFFIFRYVDKIESGYKLARIKIFLEGLFKADKYIENADIGYQVGQSLLAFGNGGILGRSYGSGVQKYNYLPEIHTDFIMALFGEEMGFIGVVSVIILFFLLYNIIVDIGITCKNYFGRYLALGIAGYIISQFLINIFVALGLLPVFGIPMPIFSYGGSSMITIFVGISIAFNINNSMFDKKQNKMYN